MSASRTRQTISPGPMVARGAATSPGFRVGSVDGLVRHVPGDFVACRTLLSLLPGWVNVHIRPARCLQHGAPSPFSAPVNGTSRSQNRQASDLVANATLAKSASMPARNSLSTPPRETESFTRLNPQLLRRMS
jgi:hypothetical protein